MLGRLDGNRLGLDVHPSLETIDGTRIGDIDGNPVGFPRVALGWARTWFLCRVRVDGKQPGDPESNTAGFQEVHSAGEAITDDASGGINVGPSLGEDDGPLLGPTCGKRSWISWQYTWTITRRLCLDSELYLVLPNVTLLDFWVRTRMRTWLRRSTFRRTARS